MRYKRNFHEGCFNYYHWYFESIEEYETASPNNIVYEPYDPSQKYTIMTNYRDTDGHRLVAGCVGDTGVVLKIFQITEPRRKIYQSTRYKNIRQAKIRENILVLLHEQVNSSNFRFHEVMVFQCVPNECRTPRKRTKSGSMKGKPPNAIKLDFLYSLDVTLIDMQWDLSRDLLGFASVRDSSLVFLDIWSGAEIFREDITMMSSFIFGCTFINNIFYYVDSEQTNFLVALDPAKKTVCWKTELQNFPFGMSLTVSIFVWCKKELLVMSGKYANVLDRSTGRVLMECKSPDYYRGPIVPVGTLDNATEGCMRLIHAFGMYDDYEQPEGRRLADRNFAISPFGGVLFNTDTLLFTCGTRDCKGRTVEKSKKDVPFEHCTRTTGMYLSRKFLIILYRGVSRVCILDYTGTDLA